MPVATSSAYFRVCLFLWGNETEYMTEQFGYIALKKLLE